MYLSSWWTGGFGYKFDLSGCSLADCGRGEWFCSMTHACRSRSMASGEYPISASTSIECSPTVGFRYDGSAGVRDSHGAGLGSQAKRLSASASAPGWLRSELPVDRNASLAAFCA